MFKVDGTSFKITVSKGDTGVLEVNFTGTTTGATALISLKESTESACPIWEKKLPITDGSVRIPFTSDDTELDFGTYVWDVRVLFTSGDIETPMNPAAFVVSEVVGNG